MFEELGDFAITLVIGISIWMLFKFVFGRLRPNWVARVDDAVTPHGEGKLQAALATVAAFAVGVALQGLSDQFRLDRQRPFKDFQWLDFRSWNVRSWPLYCLGTSANVRAHLLFRRNELPTNSGGRYLVISVEPLALELARIHAFSHFTDPHSLLPPKEGKETPAPRTKATLLESASEKDPIYVNDLSRVRSDSDRLSIPEDGRKIGPIVGFSIKKYEKNEKDEKAFEQIEEELESWSQAVFFNAKNRVVREDNYSSELSLIRQIQDYVRSVHYGAVLLLGLLAASGALQVLSVLAKCKLRPFRRRAWEEDSRKWWWGAPFVIAVGLLIAVVQLSLVAHRHYEKEFGKRVFGYYVSLIAESDRSQ